MTDEVFLFPMSFAQQRLWVLSQLQPDHSSYRISAALRLKGKLNVGALSRSINKIAERHESLRTTFMLVEGEPMQVVAPISEVSLSVVELKEQGTQEEDTELPDSVRGLAAEIIERPFDLIDGPLWRVSLLQLSSEHHILLLVWHHIISDGWSKRVFLRELSTLYELYSHGLESTLPPIDIQYGDFASWQREWEESANFAEQLAYWKKQLGRPLPVLELPRDYARPTELTITSGTLSIELSTHFSQAIRRFSQEEGVTAFMTLLATFKMLLRAYTGEEDIIVGTPMAGRNQAELERLIGFFIDTLVLRTELSANPTFRELLQRVRQVALNAYTHQDVPFEKLVEVLKPSRDLSRSPIFQVWFNMLNLENQPIHLKGLTVERLSLVEPQANFDLTLYVDDGKRIKLRLVYNATLFSKERMAELLEQYNFLLQQAIRVPDTQISDFSLVTPQAKAFLPDPTLVLNYDSEATIQSRFSQLATEMPTRQAVVGKDYVLTYGQLERLSNQLAHYLLTEGATGDAPVVAIYASRSPMLVCALLGILKAGAAFLILDSAYPAARLASYCQQAKPSVIIQLEEAGELPEALKTRKCFVLPKNPLMASQELSDYSFLPPDVSVSADDYAYIAFTSGSTGQPKGILGTQAPLSHFIRWHSRTFGLTENDRFSMLSGLAHDPLLRDIFTPLVLGATLYVPDALTISPRQLVTWMNQHQITACHLTPQMGQILTQDATRLDKLRYLFFGGDKLPASLVQKVRHLAPKTQIVNFYGATETPQAMSYFVAREAGEGVQGLPWLEGVQGLPWLEGVQGLPWLNESHREYLPIGRGIDDVQLLVLKAGHLAGISEVGEIVIRTPYLTKGYLGLSNTNSERFSKLFGIPSYKTGDLGRYMPDGNVEILGRADHQIKIRGFRIELSEIEAALMASSAIRQAVVSMYQTATGSQLVGYLVPEEEEVSIENVRAELKSLLPEYMVPSAFVWLPALPLTPNGKVDFAALPEPEWFATKAEYVAPYTPTQELLAAIWGEVLKVPEEQAISIHDNFFELGGHSLLAVQVISRVRQTFRVELPLRRLFEFPTVALLSKEIENSKEGLLPAIELVPRSHELPLSFAQRRLWFLEQLEGASAAYNIFLSRRIRGPLNLTILSQSLSELVRRHENLRTTFIFTDDQPKQVIHAAKSISLPVVELADLTAEEQEARVRAVSRTEALKPFELEGDSLWRVKLLKLAPQEHVLLVTMHHIISDAWSSGILMRELFTLYEAYSQGKPNPLPELPIQYADFAYWQQVSLNQELNRQLIYWKEHLAGELPVLDLPHDYPRPPQQSFRGQTLKLTLSEELSEELSRLSRQEGATLFMTLLAAFKSLLYRYTGQEDIIVGTPVAGRNRAELEGLIGFFINTLVLRSDLSANPTFVELLERVRQVALDAYAHQDVPFEKLVEELQPERDLSRTPIFQVWVNMLNPTGSSNQQVAGLTIERTGLGERQAKFDLSLYISNQAQIGLELVYNADLFSEARIQLMLTHLQSLLEAIVVAPDAPISSYRLPPAKGQNLVQPSNPFTEFPVSAIEQSIYSRFAEQVSKYPDKIAIKTKRYAWTYRQLNQQAAIIAQSIIEIERGTGRIALLFEHDAPMIAGMLGTLAAGKTYVPLDPTYPKERLLYILEDSQAQAIVTNKQNLEYARELTGGRLQLINLDRPSPLTPSQDWERAAIVGATLAVALPSGCPRVSPNQLAYILYTSGSTGQPKGVMQNHRNVLHFMRTYTNNLHISASDKLTLLSSYSFDAAIMDIFGALLNGATLYPFDLKQNTLGELVECLINEEITIYHSTPTVYRHLMNSLTGQEPFPKLRLIVMGGEAVYKPDLELYKKHFSDDCLFVNGLGPTESTVTLQYFINKQTELTRHAVPVGYPVDNTELLLLNEAGQETDIYGEIAIRSEHVALGYWRKEEQSAVVFSPALEGSRKRLYRMGDLGRYLPDGSLEFIGRKDTQVKIRGYRIELGEIESALSQHPAVKESAVILFDDVATDNKQLVAYFVSSESILPVELRDFMQQKLPSHMVPQAYIQLEALPQTPTGKIDRRALPAPDFSARNVQKEFVAPRTPTEELLAAIWGEVLKVPEEQAISIHDNFFELGGHSLLAVQVISRIRQTFKVNLPLRRLFEFPTIAELSVRAANEKSVRAANEKEAEPIMPIPRDRVMPLSFGQRRLWDWQQLAGESAIYKISYFRILKGTLNLVALEQSFAELVSRHESLRTTFPVVEGQPIQFIHATLPVRLPVIDLQGFSKEEQELQMRRLAHENAYKPFDLAKGPLFRLALLRLGTEEHLLLLTFHHTIIDGWSRRRLFAQWATLYEAFLEGTPASLPEISLQYADFAYWQRHTQKEMAEGLAYWKEQLSGKIPLLDFPEDYPRPTQANPRASEGAFRGESQSILLSKALIDALKGLSQQEGCTFFMTMLAAFKALLSHKTGQEDIIIGSPNASRTRTELENVVGYFVNPLALRTSLQGNPTFRELLRRVRQTVLGAYTHQDVPFEKIVASLHPQRDLNRHPIFAVWFNMLNLEKQPLKLKGLTVEPVKLTNQPTAMFDFTLSISEGESLPQVNDENEGTLKLNLTYKAELFSAVSMAQLLAEYQKLLAQIAQRPESRLFELFRQGIGVKRR